MKSGTLPNVYNPSNIFRKTIVNKMKDSEITNNKNKGTKRIIVAFVRSKRWV